MLNRLPSRSSGARPACCWWLDWGHSSPGHYYTTRGQNPVDLVCSSLHHAIVLYGVHRRSLMGAEGASIGWYDAARAVAGNLRVMMLRKPPGFTSFVLSHRSSGGTIPDPGPGAGLQEVELHAA